MIGMETSLHRQLKEHYASGGARLEVSLNRYRIDVVTAGELVEIQHGSLAAIRDKIARLLQGHCVRLVKPIVVSRRLVKLLFPNGPVESTRMSPKRGTIWDLFDELVYFTRVFPHPRLILDVPLVDVEEWRYPARRRGWRQRRGFRTADQKLLYVRDGLVFRSAADLAALLPDNLPTPFHSGHLATALSLPRFMAQRIAYCLLHTGAARVVGKQANARLYQIDAQQADAA
jgi:hypothetical protein